MGFWSFMNKMVTGKPVFENLPRRPEPEKVGDSSPFIDAKGRKIVPRITIERCKSHLNGSRMDVTARLTNASGFEVELDKIMILGTRAEIGRRLQPHEGHEVTLYRGLQPVSDHARKAILYYRIVQNGDNFSADFMVEFNRESDGKFTVEELHPEYNIVRDV
jgi:hypothetical protein